jgi:beta-lactamase regulating signal transducer with metallopeptidase domain
MNTQRLLELAANQLVQISILIAAASVVLPMLARRRPHLAYALWLAVLVKTLTPPLWSHSLAIMNFSRPIPSAAVQLAIRPTPAPAMNVRTTPAAAVVSTAAAHSWSSIEMAIVFWSIGFAGFMLSIAIRWILFERRIARSSVQPPVELSRMLDALRDELGVSRRIELRVCSDPLGPAMMGIMRPMLILPEAIVQQPWVELRPLLAHEIIHLRRGDMLVALLQLASGAIWWFNPLVWGMNRQITRARELCCDAEVICDLPCPRADYAQMLIHVLRLRRIAGNNLPIPAMRPVQINMRRLDRIMNGLHGGRSRLWRYWTAWAICALVLIPAASCSNGSSGSAGAPPAARQSFPTTVRHFVAIVVDVDGISFKGQRTTTDQLESLLEQVPDRPHTVLELAWASDDVTVGQFMAVQFRAGEWVKSLGFEYLSITGRHPADYTGKPDQVVSSGAGSGEVLSSLTPASDSELTHKVAFGLGESEFHPGDSITITQVRGTSDQLQVDGTFQVTGTYTLASADHATLAISVASSEHPRGYWGQKQQIKINRGSGTFTLTERMACQGYPHISFYNDGGSIGDVYFGTGAWVSN